MKNNIKKASVKFWEDLFSVVFSAFHSDFCLCSKSVIITILKVGSCSFESIIILLIYFLNCQRALFTRR